MAKALSISGLAVSILLLVLFGLDLATGIPFNKINMGMDIGFVISSLILAAMSWLTFRELP